MKSSVREKLDRLPAENRPADGAIGSAAEPPAEPTTFVHAPAAPNVAAVDSARDYDVVDENVGEQLDHFELLDCIGVGGMGRVYRGVDSRLDRMVAIKVLSPDLVGDGEVLRRFEQEAKAAARIDSPNFARIYFFGADKGKHYIAMEFVEGEDLRRRIQRSGRLDVDDVLRVGVQIARGLVDSDRCGVVHRDIKPSNIVVDSRGVAKLVDMGLARNLLPRQDSADDLTQAGVTLGTFDYISPEQSVDPRNVDVRSDIYSLGCTLYHALAGRPPFGDGSPLQKLMQHQNDPPPDIRQFAPHTPRELVAVLARMCAKEPSERYQSASDLLADFAELTRKRGLAIDDVASGVARHSALAHWRDHLAWAGPALVVSLVALAMTFLERPRNGPKILGPFLADAPRRSNAPATTPSAPKPADDVSQNKPATVERAPAEAEVVDVPAEPGGDLRAAIARAKKGQVLRLLGSSYAIPAAADSNKTVGIAVDKDLTIRGRRGAPTAIELVEDPAAPLPGQAPRTCFAVLGGNLTLEDVRLSIRGVPESQDGAGYATVEAGTLRTVRCSFAPLVDGLNESNAAVRLAGAAGTDPAQFSATACFFAAAPIGVEIDGSGRSQLRLQDCAFRDVARVFVRRAAGPAAVTFDHVSVFAGEAPVIDVERLDGLSIDVRESVFSQLVATENRPLVHIELSGARGAQIRNWWTGERNLYHGFESGLVEGLTETPNADFEELARVGFREAQSKFFKRSIWPWLFNDPRRDAGGNEVEGFRGFRLSVNSEGLNFDRAGEPIGVRASPWADLYESKPVVAANDGNATAAAPKAATELPAKPEEKTAQTTLIVDPGIAAGDQPRGVYRNLHTACEEAPSGATIELKGDREFPVVEQRLTAKKLTVRAAPGARVRVVFDYGDEPNLAPRLTLGAGAELRFEDLAIGVRNSPRAAHAVIEMGGGAAIAFDNCAIDIADGDDGTLFALRAPAANQPVDAHACQIVLRRCQVAVATAARIESARTLQFISEDSRWTCDGPMFRVESGAAFGVGEGRGRAIAFARSTAILRDGLLVCAGADRFGGDAPVNLEIALDGCVVVGNRGAALARLATARVGALEQANLNFKGQLNFFAGYDVFLQVTQSDAAGMLQRPYKFVEWLERTELDRDTNQLGDGDPIQVLGSNLDNAAVIGSEELRRLGYNDKFAKPPGVDAALFKFARRSEPTR